MRCTALEAYRDTLEYIIGVIAKSYAVIILVNLVALIVSIVLKNKFDLKKIRVALSGILICICLSASVVLIPRLIDLNQNAFTKIEDGRLFVGSTNSIGSGGSIMFYGYADAFSADGNSVRLTGINFFDLPQSPDPNQEYSGNIIYAKYSHQLIAVEQLDTEQLGS